ncbi:MAG: DUF6084 family protein [Vulcanimicrobiaceae bacterium]
MSELDFAVIAAACEPYAASPQLALHVRVRETSGERVHAIALRTQIQIEPQRRRYVPGESERLNDLFGPPERYGDTLRPLLWTHVSALVVGFSGETDVALHVPCSYDFAIAAHKYLTALDDGDIPLILLFSGTVIVDGPQGVASEFVPWSCEARYRLPVAVWRATMDAHFPNEAWIRMSRDTFAELDRFRVANGLRTWDAALERLCERAPVPP